MCVSLFSSQSTGSPYSSASASSGSWENIGSPPSVGAMPSNSTPPWRYVSCAITPPNMEPCARTTTSGASSPAVSRRSLASSAAKRVRLPSPVRTSVTGGASSCGAGAAPSISGLDSSPSGPSSAAAAAASARAVSYSTSSAPSSSLRSLSDMRSAWREATCARRARCRTSAPKVPSSGRDVKSTSERGSADHSAKSWRA